MTCLCLVSQHGLELPEGGAASDLFPSPSAQCAQPGMMSISVDVCGLDPASADPRTNLDKFMYQK